MKDKKKECELMRRISMAKSMPSENVETHEKSFF
jgi:hypothetical protein